MEYEKQGYLTTYFKIFHLNDIPKTKVHAHYHEFDKIILFLSGNVKYNIEGQTYQLFPYDIIFVPHNSIHYPTINDNDIYERIIIYINPYFLTEKSYHDGNLSYCFNYAKEHNSYVMNLNNIEENDIFQRLQSLETTSNATGFAQSLYTNLKFLEFMIFTNRAILNNNNINTDHNVSYDENILSIINYINQNLFTNLNIDHLANQFFLSKYYLMRKFKAETGYSIHQYILNKRLMVAKSRIKSNENLTQICFDCGFKDYSTFSRAFKQIFKQTPREFKKSLVSPLTIEKNIVNEVTQHE